MRSAIRHIVACLTILPSLSACAGLTPAKALADAQLACQVINADGPTIVAIAEIDGAPVPATEKAGQLAQANCALIGGIPAPVGSVPQTSVSITK